MVNRKKVKSRAAERKSDHCLIAAFAGDLDSSSSAASRTLGIPELVSEVVSYLYDGYRLSGDRTIFSCALVNSLWAAEVAKYLWQWCGDPPINAGDTWRFGPSVIQLLRNSGYAKYVRSLSLGTIWSQLYGSRSQPFCWEGELFPSLKRLSFPRMERLFIDIPDDDRLGNHILPPITCLANVLQPRLKHISLRGTGTNGRIKLTDELFSDIHRHCGGLQSLNIELHDIACVDGVSPDLFGRVFHNMDNLSQLSLQIMGLYKLMNPDTFRTIALLRSLQTLKVWTIRAEWVENFELESNKPFFSQLQCLYTSMGDDALELLLPYLGKLRVLDLGLHHEIGDRFSVMSKTLFPELDELRVEVGRDACFQESGLLAFVKGLPKLRILNLMSFQTDNFPPWRRLTDQTLDEVARSLPLLEDTYIRVGNPAFTQASLFSLGRHCPLLHRCFLACSIDYEKLVQDAPPNVWQNLEGLHIEAPNEHLPRQVKRSSQRHAMRVAQGMLNLMPKLHPDTVRIRSDKIPFLDEAIRELMDREGRGSQPWSHVPRLDWQPDAIDPYEELQLIWG